MSAAGGRGGRHVAAAGCEVRPARAKVLACAALLACAVLPACATAGASPAGKMAPDFSLAALDGTQVAFAAMRGSVTLLDFWASWCVPCAQELPELEKLQAAYALKGVKFITVNVDADRDAAAEMARRLKLTMTVALDVEKAVASAYNPPTMPSSYVIDRAGIIRYVHAGFDGTGDINKFRNELDALLAER